MSQAPPAPPIPEETEKKIEKKNDEETLKSFTIRVEESVIKKLQSVGEQTNETKIARIARNYLRLSEIFLLDNNRIMGHDGKELALIPVDFLRTLFKLKAGTDEGSQISFGNELGKYLRNLFYLDPRKNNTEKIDFIRRLGWFSAKKDPSTKHALIPLDFGPEIMIQAMIYQITAKKELPPQPQRGKEEKEKDFARRRTDWAEGIKKDQMTLVKPTENEIGFDSFTYD